MRKRWGVLNGLICICLVFLINTVSFASYEEKIAYERSLNDKAQHILDNMFGKYSFIVVSDVKMGNESWRVTYTKRAIVKGKKAKTGSKDYQILPGYSAIKNLATDDISKYPFNSVITKTTPRIKSRTLNIIVSKEISKREVKRAQKIIVAVLGLDEMKGDSINITYQTFPIVERLLAKDVDVEELRAQPTPMTHKFLVFLVVLFLIIYIVLQVKLLKKKTGGEGAPAAGGSAAPPPSSGDLSSKSSAPASQDMSMKHYFNFVSDDNIESVIHLIKGNKMPPQQVSIMVSFLPASLSSQILQSFDVKAQSEIIGLVVDQKVLNKETIEKLEKTVKSKLECSIGGTQLVSQIFSKIGNEDKKKLLDIFKGQPAHYQKIRPNVILIDDIQYLTDDEMKLLISELNLNMLSTALMGIEKGTTDKVKKNLSSAARAMVEQFAELKGKGLTKSEISLAHVYILDIVTRLEKDKRIELKKKIPGIKAA
ncbi:hypothetical protein DID77_00360 [Candidatus Marinamargulisbacteria bacterium SCGC AG-439-L15]|nr:hypothetical protein DID77_00360 [Candidatus Marinamargulisbacteria bacterium SCGC AG-439-L15]